MVPEDLAHASDVCCEVCEMDSSEAWEGENRSDDTARLSVSFVHSENLDQVVGSDHARPRRSRIAEINTHVL